MKSVKYNHKLRSRSHGQGLTDEPVKKDTMIQFIIFTAKGRVAKMADLYFFQL